MLPGPKLPHPNPHNWARGRSRRGPKIFSEFHINHRGFFGRFNELEICSSRFERFNVARCLNLWIIPKEKNAHNLQRYEYLSSGHYRAVIHQDIWSLGQHATPRSLLQKESAARKPWPNMTAACWTKPSVYVHCPWAPEWPVTNSAVPAI